MPTISDIMLLVISGAGVVAPQFVTHASHLGVITPAGLNGLDRPYAGRRSDQLDRAGTIAAVVGTAGPVGLALGLAPTRDRMWTNLLVLSEAVAVNGAINQGVKLAVHRPRPYAYGLATGDPLRDRADTTRSFYSMHTSIVVAAGTCWAVLEAREHPDAAWRWIALGWTAVAGTTVGMLRVKAGRHFPSDVLTGAVAGTLTGVAVPWLRARGVSVSATTGSAGAMLVCSNPF